MCTVILTPGDNPIAVNKHIISYSGVLRNFFSGGGGSKNSVEDTGQRERTSGDVAP